MTRRAFIASSIGAVGIGLLVVSPALAQDLTKLKLNIIPSGDLFGIAGRLVSNLLLFFGVIAFFYLLYAGFNYLTAGGDDTKAKAARTTILNVVIGIFIIAISYVLLRFVIDQTKTSDSGAGTPTTRPSATSPVTPRPRRP